MEVLLGVAEAEGKLPSHVKKVSLPGYWKDSRTERRIPRLLVRSDCYRLEAGFLRLPFGLRARWSGKLRWRERQGRLEVVYHDLSRAWYAMMPMEAVPPHPSTGNKRAYVDLGVVNLITVWVEGDRHAVIYSGRPLLADW